MDSSFEELIEEENRHLEELKEHEEVKDEAEEHAETQMETADMLRHMDDILSITTKHLGSEDLFGQILARLREVLEVPAASILLLDEKEKSLYFRASDGLEDAVMRRIRIEVGTDHSGRVASSGRPHWWSHLDPRTMVNPIMVERGLLAMAAVPIKGDDGVLGVLEVAADPGREFDEAEMRILEVSAHHIYLALDRAAVLHDLQVARRRAEEANRFKTTLMQTLSHDLKTPLTAITMQVQLVATDKLADHKRAAALHRIEGNLRMMQLMLDDFLDMARIEADRFTFHPKDVDVARVIQGVIDLYSAQATGGHIDLTYQGRELRAEVDERRLRQVLANLISNAIRYNEPGGKITVAARRTDHRLEISVQDTGQGMTSAQLRQASLPFAQVHGSRREQQGTGLGLFLTRRILEEQGGSLRLESRGPGLGTTATVALPV